MGVSKTIMLVKMWTVKAGLVRFQKEGTVLLASFVRHAPHLDSGFQRLPVKLNMM